MIKTISPFKIQGCIAAVASKSYIQRAMAIASIANKPSILENIQWSEDAKAAHNVIRQLGCKTILNDHLTIIPSTHILFESIHLDVKESGLSMRLFSALSMKYDFPITITGYGSLMKRSIQSMLQIMDEMNINYHSKNGLLPITINGPLIPGEYHIDCSSGSQFLSGLLLLCPLLNGDTKLHVSQLKSKPYIDMTLGIMKDFGIEITHRDYKVFNIPGNQSYKGRKYTIEGDWSAAANFLVAAAISGEVTITQINPISLQADRAILDALDLFGTNIILLEDEITISQGKLQSFDFDATNCPDLFPPLVVLAAAANGISRIKGTHRLSNKESNRLDALMTNFGRLGLKMEAINDELIIYGTGTLQGGEIDSYNDHRMAMAASIAATISKEPIIIKNAEAVSKSYPNFYKDLEKIS